MMIAANDTILLLSLDKTAHTRLDQHPDMTNVTKSMTRDSTHASVKTGKAAKGTSGPAGGNGVTTVAASTSTAKESILVHEIENIGAKQRIEVPDDGRPLIVSIYLSLLLFLL